MMYSQLDGMMLVTILKHNLYLILKQDNIWKNTLEEMILG